MKFKKNILIFITGAPASGKDTQAKLLAKKLKAKKITISDVLRDFFENYKRKIIKINKKIINLNKEKENFNQGKLVSFHFVRWVGEKIIKENLPLKNNLIIVGGPRSLIETKGYLSLLKREKINYAFLYIKVSEETIFRRTAERKRSDDTLSIVKTRIEYFKKFSLPAINYLRKKGEIIEVDGDKSVKEVHKEIWGKIKTRII